MKLPPRHTASPLLAQLLLTTLGLLAVGCGGRQPGPTMPTGSQSWLALMPRDAHTLMIAEVDHIRETPHAAEMLAEARLAEAEADTDEPTEVPGLVTPPVGAAPMPPEMQTQDPSMTPERMRERIEQIDRVAIAVGGLMATPYNPDLEGLPSDVREFQEMMAVFGDQIPTFVAIFQGAGAPGVCQEAQGDAQTRTLEGYTVAVTEHAAFLVLGDVCTVTMRGAYSALLEERAQPLPALASRAQPVSAPHTPEGSSRLFSFATDHRSEGARELWDAWRASDQRAAAEAAERAAAEDGDDAEGDSLERRLTRSMGDATRRMRIAMRVFWRVLNEHVVGTAWTVWRSPTGYHVASRTEYDDDDRATMWREWSTMYSDVLHGIVDEGALPDEVAEVVSPVLDSAYIEESGDSLQIGYAITDAWIADVRRRAEEENSGSASSSGEAAPDDELDELRNMVNASHGDADEVLAGLDGKQAQIATLEHDALRSHLVMRLGWAYAQRGRYTEAAATFALGRQGTAHTQDWELASRLGFYEETSRCEILTAETAVHIEYGYAEAALTAIDASNEFCPPYRSAGARADVLLALGRFDEAAALYAQDSNDMAGAAAAALRLRVARGQMTEANAIAEAICPSLDSPACRRIASEVLTARAAVATSVTPLAAELENQARGHRSQDVRARAAATECSLRQRLAARSADTELACRRAVDVAVAAFTENHPRVAMARSALATTLQARRNRSEAAAQREAAAPIIETLGPSHPLRRTP